MTYEDREKTTHGQDGVLLGTAWCDMSKGHVQCSALVKRTWSEEYLCCALVEGHDGGHRNAYVGPQLAQSAWIESASHDV